MSCCVTVYSGTRAVYTESCDYCHGFWITPDSDFKPAVKEGERTHLKLYDLAIRILMVATVTLALVGFYLISRSMNQGTRLTPLTGTYYVASSFLFLPILGCMTRKREIDGLGAVTEQRVRPEGIHANHEDD